MAPPTPLEVRLSGEFACFTRPEMKVERVSYPVPTPSAARGALEAIFWKPQVDWIVEEIHVLKPIKYFSLLRNETNNRQSDRVARNWMQNGGGYDAAGDRAQRHTLGLRDVAYLVKAQLALRPGATEDIAKYRDQFRRRVASGQCFATPFLGCREFSADFGPAVEGERPIDRTEDLGPMLLDLEFELPRGGERRASGKATPRFFRATLKDGVLHVPNRFTEVH